MSTATMTRTTTRNRNPLPLPGHYNPGTVHDLRLIPYNELAVQARDWAKKHDIPHRSQDRPRICLLPIDVMITFCMQKAGAELYVAGAEDDTVRSAEFVYRNLHNITEIDPTIDLHTSMQIFHEAMWINEQGEHPTTGAMRLPPGTSLNLPGGVITGDDVATGKWRIDPAVAESLGLDFVSLQSYGAHYTKTLSTVTAGKKEQYPLMIWPYHAMLGGIGMSLVPLFEEAVFFHNVARASQTGFAIKGGNPLAESYSVLGPEVTTDSKGRTIAPKNVQMIEKLLNFDYVIILGQAKSHCVAWTIEHLLQEIKAKDPRLAKKVYLVEDCTSPVIVPGIVDFTQQANASFDRFRQEGMHIVQSTVPMDQWPDLKLA